MTARTILTYKDYETLPADGRRYELHEGGLSVTPAPTPRHQEISGNLFVLLHVHVQNREMGKVLHARLDCILSDTTIVQPDIVYLETRRFSAISGRGIEGPPTLVVEILSPSTAEIDRGEKLQLYAQHEVPFYWIVDPDARTIEACRLSDGAYQLTGRLAGGDRSTLAPFAGLDLVPSHIWP